MDFMKTNTVVIAWLLCGLAIVPHAGGQEPRSVPARAEAILAQFPAGSRMQRDILADEMLAMGEAGIAEFTRRLVPASAGGDAAVRFALNAVAVRASEFGAEPNRATAERALVNALAMASDVEVRTFLLRQLRLVGRNDAVRAAAPFLSDAALVEPATQLMLSVNGLAAGRALLSALDTARGPAQITMVKALGELKAGEAHDRLVAFARDANPDMRRSALAGLARLANRKSYKALSEAAERAGFIYDPANATAAFLDYAKNLADKGDPEAAEKVCRLIMKKTKRADQLATRAAALDVLVDVRGHEALRDLLKAIDHADRAYRQSALRSAERLRGIAPIRQWDARAQKADPERRAEIIAMLGRQGDRHALPVIRASLGARDSEVMLAAAEALAHIDRAGATPDLLPLLKTADGPAVERVADILRVTIDERHLDPLVAMLDTLPLEARAAAVGLIGAKGGRRFSARILPLTTDHAPEIRAAAFGALAGVANAGDLAELLRMLDDVDADVLAAVQKAVAASAAQLTPDEARVAPLLQAMTTSSHKERIVEVLPQVGGRRALAAVVESFGSSDDDLKAAAFRALSRWPGIEAADRLFAIFARGDATYRNPAFSAFVRQISASTLPADQKVLQLRKGLALASTTGDRRILIRAMERIRTFQSFLLAAALLEDAEVADEAAAATMRIALPTAPDAHDGMSGAVVRTALDKAMLALKGPQADSDRESIRAYLATMPPDEGFVPLFNGRDLSGWKGLVGNPASRARMPQQELAQKQVEADARATANWSVRDGTIVFNGNGDNLCTIKDYGDFEMIVDWRITKGGDSGIYLRGSPQVQIWDPARADVGAQVGSGGLYNNTKNPSTPLVFADNPVGDWNTFRITMVGDKVTVLLNGIKVVDNETMENYWDRTQPIVARDAIELQAHGTDLAFRDIYVRDLTGAGYGLTGEERAEGFVALFNGRNLDGWVGNPTGYTVADGAIEFDPKAGDSSNLYTAREYGDFQFRFEFQLTPGANSGVAIRAPREGDAAYVGMEIQVLDDTAPIYAALQPYQYHGSVYGIIPAKRGSLKPVGDWNAEEILIRGSRIRVTVNGTVIVDGDLAEATRYGTLDHRPHPGLQRTAGAIGWLSHDSAVRFRNVRIKELWPVRK
jgi:HEAT repeat protein